jgi:putative transcriptional regulator
MKNRKGKTDWARVMAMTEEEILAAARSDPDAQPLTTAELKKFKRVHPPGTIDAKKAREDLGLSQKQFAEYFGVSIRTIQEWEQHRRKPTAVARNFLTVIIREPQAVQRALSHHSLAVSARAA